MKFRQFLRLSEAGNLPASAYGGDVRYDLFGMPTVNTQALAAKKTPPGGYSSVGQIAQHYTNVERLQDKDYIFSQTLQSIANLALNVVGQIKHNQDSKAADPNFVPRHYKYAIFQQNPPMIFWLTSQDIISGLYPRIKTEDWARAQQLGVMVKATNEPQGYNHQEGDLYNIDLAKLREAMIEMAHTMADKEHGHQSAAYLAGLADKIVGYAFGGGKIQLTHGANPFGG